MSQVFRRSWLGAFVLLSYVPFLGFRVARMAGDEKVYVAQAIEMERRGTWFLQFFSGSPNYYKGPLHYLLLRVGFLIFGHHMWATVWMNLALVLFAAYALANLARERLGEAKGLPLWLGASFATCAGVYGFVFASQMEAELAAFFAIGMWLLDRATEPDRESSRALPATADLPSAFAGYAFWAWAGLAGWIKSPVYSALLGVSAILFWAWQGILLRKLARAGEWAQLGVGMTVGIAGYLPAILQDRAVFVATYLGRETFGKGDNGGYWYEALLAITTSFLLPWMFVAWVRYGQAVSEMKTLARRSGSKPGARLERLALSILIPSIIFFILHPYHGQSYNVPVLGAMLAWIAAGIASAPDASFTGRAYRFALYVTGASFAIAALGFAALAGWAGSVNAAGAVTAIDWLPEFLLPCAAIGAALAPGILFMATRHRRWDYAILGTLGFYLGLGALLAAVGEAELRDLRPLIARKSSPVVLGYWDIGHPLWSEWGYLNCMVPARIDPLWDEAAVSAALQARHWIILPGDGARADFERVMQPMLAKDLNFKLEWKPWRRWRLQGRSDAGEPLTKVAFREHDLSKLERNFWLVRRAP